MQGTTLFGMCGESSPDGSRTTKVNCTVGKQAQKVWIQIQIKSFNVRKNILSSLPLLSSTLSRFCLGQVETLSLFLFLSSFFLSFYLDLFFLYPLSPLSLLLSSLFFLFHTPLLFSLLISLFFFFLFLSYSLFFTISLLLYSPLLSSFSFPYYATVYTLSIFYRYI